MNKLLNKIGILALSALPLSAQANNTAINGKGYEIYEGQYVSTLLVGDVSHDYIGNGYHNIAYFENEDGRFFFFTIHVHSNGATDGYFTFESNGSIDLIDWKATNLQKPTDKYYFITGNRPIYFNRPLKATGISTDTNKYLATTSPALSYAGGYDGFIPSFNYTYVSANKDYLSSITSVNNIVTGQLWKSGDVASLNIEKDGFIIQYYYIGASVDTSKRQYDVWLYAYGKSKDNRLIDLNIKELAYIDLNMNIRNINNYNYPQPVPTLETKSGYYNIIRSNGAYGITDSIINYETGYKVGQENPTFKTFIISSFDACSSFFNIPVLGDNITIGTLIGSFVGLGALFLLIRLFR